MVPFSPGQKYVQDIIRNDIPGLVFDWVYNKRGHFYVCGDVTMASDVNQTLIKVIASESDLTETEADNYVMKMKVSPPTQKEEGHQTKNSASSQITSFDSACIMYI